MKSKLSLAIVLALLAAVSGRTQTAGLSQTVNVINTLGVTTNVPAELMAAASGLPAPNPDTVQARIEIRADSAGAVADYGLLKVRFTPNLAESRPVTISARGGQAIAFRPAYIVLVKRSTGETWIVGQLTNSVLQVGSSEAVYRDAFDTISADLRYGYAANGSRLEQFLTLREKIVLPKELEGSESDLDLECWTEFFLQGDPVSVRESSVVLRPAQPGFSAVEATDQSTDLGGLRIPGAGKAFSVGEEQETIPVAKTWITVEDPKSAGDQALAPRRFLSERTDWLSLKPKLDKLPAPSGHASFQLRKTTRSLLARMARPAPSTDGSPARVLVARSSSLAKSGVVIDFAVVAPQGLVAWWRAENNADDITGTFSGTPQGSMAYAAAEVGQGFNLDGVDDWVSVNPAPGLNFGAGADFSIEGWINPITTNTTYGVQMVLDQRVTTPYDDGAVGYALYLVYGRVGCQLADGPLASYQYHAYGPAGPDLRTNGAFHHVAMTVDRDSTNGLVLYVDGTAVLTNDPTVEPGSLSSTNGPLRIGKHATVNAPFKGIIDELSIYSRALTQAEVQSVYNAGADGKALPPTITTQPESQTVAAGANVTFTVIATGSAPLSYQWKFNNQDICGATTSSYSRSTAQPADQGNYSVLVSNPGGSVTSANAALTVSGAGSAITGVPSGLVSWWRAECGASDVTALNPGTLMNGAGFDSGEVGRGFSLNGAGRYVRVASSPSLRLSQELTLECWYKDTGATAWYGLVAKRSPSYPYTTTFGINIYPGIVAQAYFLDPAYGSFKVCDHPVVPTPNVFHHLAATYRQTDPAHVEVKLYIDGACVKTTSLSGNLANCQNDAPVTIGASYESGEYAVGVVDEASIYDRALSDAEISGIFNAGAAGKNAADVDSDGLPDSWERQFFGNLTQTATDDFDSDGLSNLEEYQLGTNPTRSELAVSAFKNFCEDKFEFDISNSSGQTLNGGTFELFAFFDGQTRTPVAPLYRWASPDVLQDGDHGQLTLCTTDHSILNFDCLVLYQNGSVSAASPKFRITSRDGLLQLVRNTTRMAADGNPPQSRPADDPWPQPLPLAPGGADWQRLDNFYRPSDPPEYVQSSPCPKRGFKNVYAVKQWHGAWSPKSSVWGAISAMNGDGTCRTPAQPQNMPDTTKYLRKTATGISYGEYIYDDEQYPYTSGSVSSDCRINRHTGKATGSASESGDAAGAWLAVKDINLTHLPDIYCQKVGDYVRILNAGLPGENGYVIPAITYSGRGSTASMSWDYTWNFSCTQLDGTVVTSQGYSRGLVQLNLVAGTYSYTYDKHDATLYSEGGSYSDDDGESGNITVTETQVTSSADSSWAHTLNGVIDEGGSGSSSGSITYSEPYTSEMVSTDCDALLATWDLLDDDQYPWRTDAGITRGPLVTYNERLATAPSLVSPGFMDTSPPPWPSQQPEGPNAILGAPLPVRGLSGEICTNEPYFNFYHVNWRFEETGRGQPQPFPDSYGAFSPYPNATQWIDDQQARVLPAGPFYAYGSSFENGDHFMFRLKDPYLTDTLGNYEQGGMPGGCLIKCKWAETLTSPTPPGNDLVFKDWTFKLPGLHRELPLERDCVAVQ